MKALARCQQRKSMLHGLAASVQSLRISACLLHMTSAHFGLAAMWTTCNLRAVLPNCQTNTLFQLCFCLLNPQQWTGPETPQTKHRSTSNLRIPESVVCCRPLGRESLSIENYSSEHVYLQKSIGHLTFSAMAAQMGRFPVLCMVVILITS